MTVIVLARSVDDRDSCFQCDLDIPHVCYAGIPNARWGMTDEAVAALEALQRHVRDQRRAQPRTTTKKRRAR